MPEPQETLEKLLAKVEDQGRKIDEIHESVAKIRSYMFWTAVTTVVFFVLPLVGLAFAIPFYLKTLTAGLSGI
jgi:hypothetical protein